MFVFHDAELTNIALHNDLSEFIENLEYNNELTLEDKQFIGLFFIQNPYSKSFSIFERYDYLLNLNTALKLRKSLCESKKQ